MTVAFTGTITSQNWMITPAALAVGEPAPKTILDQKWSLLLTGIAELNFQGNSTSQWLTETLIFTPDGFQLGSGPGTPALDSGPLFWAINEFNIPEPSPNPKDYLVVLSLQEWAPFATLSSIFDKDQSIDAGFAVNAWRPRPFFTGISFGSFPAKTINNIFSGVEVDLAVRDTDASIMKVSYSINLLGKIAFVLPTFIDTEANATQAHARKAPAKRRVTA